MGENVCKPYVLGLSRESYYEIIDYERHYREIYDEELSQVIMEAEVPQSALCKLETLESQWSNSNPSPKAWEPGEALV